MAAALPQAEFRVKDRTIDVLPLVSIMTGNQSVKDQSRAQKPLLAASLSTGRQSAVGRSRDFPRAQV